MFRKIKDEEVSSMTQPLLPPSQVDVEIPYPTENGDLIDDLIRSINETAVVSQTPQYVQHQYRLNDGVHDIQENGYMAADTYLACNGISNGTSTQNGSVYVHSYDQSYGIGNPNFVGDPYPMPTINLHDFEIEYIQYPVEVVKNQRRQHGDSQQRLQSKDAKVRLVLKMFDNAQVSDIKVFVSRKNDPSFQMTDTCKTPVYIPSESRLKSSGEYHVSLDLDSVYKVDGKKVYALAKNRTDEANLFFLKIQVIYSDGSTSEADTKTFKIIGRATDNTKKGQLDNSPSATPSYLPAPIVPGSKRQRTATDESTSSTESWTSSGRQSRSTYSPGTFSNSSAHEDGLMKASRIAADYLEATHADIGALIVAQPIKTKRGDIAYHFILKNPDDHPQFEEGEIVGLFANESGNRVLDKLTQKNSVDATLKGVISRSYFIEANMQPKGVRTETICMFGIVPVKTKGSVRRGDILYASPDTPGVAVSSSDIGVISLRSNDAAAIGMAWEDISADDDELNHVQSLVSVTMEIFQKMIERRMRSVKRGVYSDIESIKKARKKSKKKVYVCAVSLTIFVVLLSILLWQLFMPMSALRLWLCGRGHIDGHSASFYYIPTKDVYSLYFAKGKEFTFYNLKRKVNEDFEPINGTGFRYYYNIDRCANFGKSETDPMLKKKAIGGPNLFAVNKFCQRAYYYYGVKGRWCRYKSAQNIVCEPPGMKPPLITNSTDTGPGYC